MRAKLNPTFADMAQKAGQSVPTPLDGLLGQAIAFNDAFRGGPAPSLPPLQMPGQPSQAGGGTNPQPPNAPSVAPDPNLAVTNLVKALSNVFGAIGGTTGRTGGAGGLLGFLGFFGGPRR